MARMLVDVPQQVVPSNLVFRYYWLSIARFGSQRLKEYRRCRGLRVGFER